MKLQQLATFYIDGHVEGDESHSVYLRIAAGTLDDALAAFFDRAAAAMGVLDEQIVVANVRADLS